MSEELIKPTEENSENNQQTSEELNEKDQEVPAEQIAEEVDHLIEDLPKEKQKAFRELILSIERSSWRGPLPPPDILKQYNDAVPDGAERILRMAELQLTHRVELEKKIIPAQMEQSNRGQLMAFIICISFLIVSGILIWQGHEASGTIIGTVDLVALATIFIIGKKDQAKDKDDKE